MAYFISNQHTKKGFDSNVHTHDGIYSIKGKSTLYVKVANYTNKHITFNKGQCIGHMEPPIDRMSQTSVNSVTTQKMIDDQIPSHALFSAVKQSLDELLYSFKSQFAKHKTRIGTTNLAKMQIDAGISDPVSQKPYSIAMKHYDWVKDKINKLLDTKLICSSHSRWSASIIVVLKGNGGECLVTDYRALHKVT